MQLFALNRFSRIISAKNADKKEIYFCLECKTALRCRGGFHKQPHFYHSQENRTCRQNGKSMEHLQVQMFLQKAIGEKECTLEVPFKEINRIADAVWLSKKIIFEVQCSPISEAEVRKRNADYGSLGFSVVWILHDKRFNQKKVFAAENYLQRKSCYFTNIDKNGQGIIYDCFWVMEKGVRIFSTPFFQVVISNLQEVAHQMLQKRKKEIPFSLWKKIEELAFCFEGDLTTHVASEKATFPSLFKEILEREKKKSKFSLKRFFYDFIVYPYKILLHMLLESASV